MSPDKIKELEEKIKYLEKHIEIALELAVSGMSTIQVIRDVLVAKGIISMEDIKEASNNLSREIANDPQEKEILETLLNNVETPSQSNGCSSDNKKKLAQKFEMSEENVADILNDLND